MIATTEQVEAWLTSNGVGPAGPATEQAHQSAEAWVEARVRLPEGPAPADLVLAVCLMTARFLARRNSPDGFVGMGEFGPARVSRIDQDRKSVV